jgi:hypothetical protein
MVRQNDISSKNPRSCISWVPSGATRSRSRVCGNSPENDFACGIGPTQKLTTEILAAAIERFEGQKRRIDEQIAQLRQMLDGGRSEMVGASEAPKGKRRKMSAAARKRISDAQKKRWAASKRPSEPTLQAAASETPKRKRKISAAGKRAIAAATRKRWAAFRAAKVAEKPGLAKKGAKIKITKKAVTKVATKTAAKRRAKKAPESSAPVAAQ